MTEELIEEAFYWVLLDENSDWEVAQWENGQWWFCGADMGFESVLMFGSRVFRSDT